MKDTLKILCFNKGAIINHYVQNPNEIYAPTHIFPLIDPAPEQAHAEYKTWGTDDKLYKEHWNTPYIIGQLDQQDHIHFSQSDHSEGMFLNLLDREVEIQHYNNADDVKNIDNIITDAKQYHNNVIVIVHRLHSYCIPLAMWQSIHRAGINIVIDNAFEAESYSLHRLFFWLHTMFGKADFVKYLYSAHSIPFNDGKMSRSNLIKQEFGVELVEVEFFMLHELQGNKASSDNDERNPLIHKNFNPDNIYKNNKPYKFICLNNYMKDHRLYIINHLVQNGLIDKGIVSARFSLDPNKPFYNHGVNDFGSLDAVNDRFDKFHHALTRDDYTSLSQALPIIIEDDLIDNQHAVNSDMFSQENNSYEFRDRWVNWEWYANTEFTIANESSFDPDLISQPGIFSQYVPDYNQTVYYPEAPNDTGFLTEKTFKPIMYGHPFILVTHPGALERLRKLGFETFPEWFDEGYDNIGESDKRIKHITEQTIHKACTNTLDINTIKDKLEHNRNHFFNVQTTVDLFNNLFDDLTRHDK